MRFFSPKMLHIKEVMLPRTPQEFAKALIQWGTDASHENSSLLLDCDVLRFMKDWALSYYSDSCLCCVLRECVVIGSYMPFDGKTVVVLDELLLTYPDHKLLYSKKPGKPSTILGLYVAHLSKEEE